MGPRIDPRTLRTRQKVVAVAAQLLVAEGFERITIDAIATESGVARSTIYRNWPSTVDLLVEAFVLLKSVPNLEPTGDLGVDLRYLARALGEGLEHADWSKTLPSLVAAAEFDPELKSAFVAFTQDRRSRMRDLFLGAIERGDIAPVPHLEAVLDRIAGALFYRRLFSDRPMPPEGVETLVQLALNEVGYHARGAE